MVATCTLAASLWLRPLPARAWVKVCGMTNETFGTSIACVGPSEYLVAGYVDAGDTDFFVMKIDAEGRTLRKQQYTSSRTRLPLGSNRYRINSGESRPSGDFAWVGLAPTRDHGAVVVLESALVRLNADGTPRWARQYLLDGANSAIFSSVAEHVDGDLLLCGVRVLKPGNMNNDHILLMRVSPDGQEIRWTKAYAQFKGERHPGFLYLRQRTPGGAPMASEECLYVGTRTLGTYPDPQRRGRTVEYVQGLVARIELDGSVGWARSLDTGRTDDKDYDRNGLGAILGFQALGVVPSGGPTGLASPSYDLVVCLGQKVKPITHPNGQAVLVTRLDPSGGHVWSRLIHSSAVDGFSHIGAVVPFTGPSPDGGGLFLAGGSTEFQDGRSIMNHNAFLLKLTVDGEFEWIRSLGLIKRSYSSEECVDEYATAATWGPRRDVLFAGASESFSKPLPWYAKPQENKFDLLLARMAADGTVGQGEALVSKKLYDPPKKVKCEVMPGGGGMLQVADPSSPLVVVETVSYAAGELDLQERDLGASDPSPKIAPRIQVVGKGSIVPLQQGKSGWQYDGTSGLIKVWASAFADIVEQVSDPSWIYSDQSAIKVTDYQTIEVTGTTGAWYRADITATGMLKGIVDRIDYTLPVGGSATKYAVELVVGLAETGDPQNVATAHGLVQRVWERHNSLVMDFLADAGWAVVGGAVSLGIGAALPAKWVGTVILDNATSVILNMGQVGVDTINADECVSQRYAVVFTNVLLQAGKRYTVYAHLRGHVAAVSTGIASGVCELDFWHHAPHISDSADRDKLGGRGFKLLDVSVRFAALTDFPPDTPSNPSPPDGATLDITAAQTAPPIPLLSWSCADPEGAALEYALYFGDTFPLRKSGVFGPFAKASLPGTLKPGTTYFWRIVVLDDGKIRTEGPLWRFCTGNLNISPVFKVSSPTNGEVDTARKVPLQWYFADPNGDPLSYDLYFGASDPPPLLLRDFTEDHGDPRHTIGGLSPETTYYWSIEARDGKDGVGKSPLLRFTTGPISANRPPSTPVVLWPPDGTRNVPCKNAVFTWTTADPDGDFLVSRLQLHTTEEVSLGRQSGVATSAPAQVPAPRVFQFPANTDLQTYTFSRAPAGELERNRQYWWRTVTQDIAGDVCLSIQTSPNLTFWTQANRPPTKAVLVRPLLNATTERTNVVLSWSCTDPDEDALTYEVYLSSSVELLSNQKLQKVAEGLAVPTFTVAGPLSANTEYYWEVVARDSFNATTRSDTFVFRTRN